MHDAAPAKTRKPSVEKRVLNEFSNKILNEERLEKIVETRKSSRHYAHSNVSFLCECDSKDCGETILMPSEEYQHVHTKTKHFVVVPSHVRLDLEIILASFSNYTLVEKFFPRKSSK